MGGEQWLAAHFHIILEHIAKLAYTHKGRA